MNLMLLRYEDMFTILLFIIGFIVVIAAQFLVKNAYNKYRKISSNKSMSGFEVARLILDSNGYKDVHIVEIQGDLTDHFDPSRNVVRLSSNIFHGDSIASIAVAAHEVGHVIQHKQGYTLIKIRALLVPVVNLVTNLGYFVMLISFFSGLTNFLMVGIVMILATLIFQLITLPVEFDASKRANEQLKKLNIINDKEEEQIKEMLKAAAMTYVASLIATILNLLRLILMNRNRD